MTTHVRRLAAVAGLIAAVVIVAWYFLLWSPQSKSLSSAHRAHAAAEQKIGDLNGQVGQLQSLVKQIPTDAARLKTYEAAVPNNPSLDSALDQIQQAASASGVTVTAVGPSTPTGASGTAGAVAGAASQASSGTPAVSVTITANGPTLTQIENFLTALAKAPRVVVIDRIQYSGSTSVTANIGARIFYAGQPTP